jgi:hypothetical protein
MAALVRTVQNQPTSLVVRESHFYLWHAAIKGESGTERNRWRAEGEGQASEGEQGGRTGKQRRAKGGSQAREESKEGGQVRKERGKDKGMQANFSML